MAGFKPFCRMLKRAMFALFVVFSVNSAFACNTDTEIDVNGDGTQCEDVKFTLDLSRSSNITSFSFYMSAKGTFYVDCGNGGTLASNSATNYPVSGKTVNRTYGTGNVRYYCTWASGTTHTIKFGGVAEGYNTNTDIAAIRFNYNTTQAAYITSVSGNLSAMFPYITGNAQSGAQPRFYQTFNNATNLKSVPDTLFANYTTPATYMFYSTFNNSGLTSIPGNLFSTISGAANHLFRSTFAGCSGLTSIPSNLFSTISGAADGLFYGTFQNCTGLTSIPSNLFSTISGAAEALFSYTFNGCTGLTSIPGNLFSGVSGGASSMFSYTFNDCSSISAIPAGLFSGVNQAATALFMNTFSSSGVSGYIPPTTFSGLISAGSPQSSSMWTDTFSYTNLTTACPQGTTQYITEYEGGTNGSTWNGKVSCTPNSTTAIAVTLDSAGATTNATPSTIYLRYGDRWYSDSSLSNQLSAITTIPVKAGYIFGGFYTHPNGSGIQIIKPNGVILQTQDTIRFTTTATTIYAYWMEPKFTLTTQATTEFQFKLAASGTFYVDCGNGGTLSPASGSSVSGNTITKTTTGSVTYTCSWDSSAPQTVRFAGAATGYNSGESTATIRFNVNNTIGSDTNAPKITGIDGSLGAIFGTVDNPTPSGAISQPRFYYTFAYATGLEGSIPDELFYGVHGAPVSKMFVGTFVNCGSLTGSIPETLFCENTTNPSSSNCIYGAPTTSIFYQTFNNCSSLSGSIPEKLFAGIRGAPAEKMFYQTFYGCSSLSGSIPGKLFCQNPTSPSASNCIYGDPAVEMFRSTFNGATNLSGAIPTTLFAGISGAPADNMFYYTFRNDSLLTGMTDGTTTTSYVPESFLGAVTDGTATNPVGYMFSGTGLASSCPAGTYTVTRTQFNNASKPWCSPCAAGTYTSTTGQTSCSVCATGTYADTPGATSCSACPSGYNANTGTTAADHDQQSDCKIRCSAGTQVATANAACSIPSGSWYTAQHYVNYGSTSSSSVQECPGHYRITDAKKPVSTDHDEKSDCKITCNAGYVVATADAGCTVPSSGYQTGSHTVSAGSVTPTSTDTGNIILLTGIWYSCLTGYTATGKVATDHDNRNDCKITCAAGTRIASANATSCTTPTGSWYIGSNTVSAGSTSSPSNCSTGYSTPNTTTATDHDSASDCAAHQINIVWDGVTSQNALANDVRQVSYDGDIKTPSSANLAQQTGAQFVGWKFDKS